MSQRSPAEQVDATATGAPRLRVPDMPPPPPPGPAPPAADEAKISEIKNSRRRLSMMSGARDGDGFELDGAGYDEEDEIADVDEGVPPPPPAPVEEAPKQVFSSFYSLSRVGYVPFNPTKVNQDRACEVAPFGKALNRAFFGVFDGHGQHGHLVSQHVANSLPRWIATAKDFDADPARALTAAFVSCNSALATSGKIDCTFSGTTAVTVFFDGTRVYCANVGDSRAVLGYTTEKGELSSIALSSDQKPDREDERQRIVSSNGRVEACRTSTGEEIGPARVWLKSQDVPGLAMTRSFGDLVAASVGVIARPEISVYDIEAKDRFMILGSDGIWEFISSQRAVEIVGECKTPREACEKLVQAADASWRAEEEVIDDITALVIFF